MEDVIFKIIIGTIHISAFVYIFLWCKNDLKKDRDKIKALDCEVKDSLKRISKLTINNSKRG